ncbi:hypothetical protein MBAV_005015 [Candidatus Magnetobacterium bavaricum]|uniref:Uncharacterized protein n=1 Tax=Candidatus Magnetobacterium bavaricum TaxID=29290 RepID=A0A0F3GLG9_9BACT|nr:hypothetical protein MBAV_005015 [Candidatus Magnetobacterium bavaricum]
MRDFQKLFDSAYVADSVSGSNIESDTERPKPPTHKPTRDVTPNTGNSTVSNGKYKKTVAKVILAIAIIIGLAFIVMEVIKDADFYVKEGDKLLKSEKHKDAIKLYTKAIKKDSELAQAYSRRSYAYYLINEYPDAITDCSKAIELDPVQQAPYEICAYANHEDIRQTKKYDSLRLKKAVDYAERAIDKGASIKKSALSNIYISLSYAYLNENNNREAIITAGIAIDLNPKNAAAYTNYGVGNYLGGDRKLGIESLRRAAALGSTKAAEILNKIEN